MTDTRPAIRWENFMGDREDNDEQADGYWSTCDLRGPHDRHKDEHTGLTWTTTAEEPA